MGWDAPLEKDIEAYYRRQCIKRGWRTEKFTSTGRRSVPDQITTKGGGDLFFTELKAPGKKPTHKQLDDHRERRERGFRVYVADTKEAVDEVMAIEEMLE